MRWELASFCSLAACSFSAPGAVEPDGPPAPPDSCATFSSQLDTCAIEQHGMLDLSGDLVFDTDTGVLRDNGITIDVASATLATRGVEVRALLAGQVIFRPNTHLRAQGSRGFAIVATEGITLQTGAVLDVSAGGAGARMMCNGGPAAGAIDSGGSAGGGGGGFGMKGGDGGNGDADQGQSQGGRGGDAASAMPPGPLGGCPGAPGGDQAMANPDGLGGSGGSGGGVVYLVSKTSIEIADGAGIQAGGGGGGGGTRISSNGDAGGGGGGSGGMIFLEAPVIRSTGILAANGGGGGQGSGDGDPGAAGSYGLLGIAAAPGGHNSASSGSDGGAGGHLAKPVGAKPMMVGNGAGGGGGGGGGIIRVGSPDAQLGTLVSPASS